MKRGRIFRLCAGALGALLLLSMCACKQKQQSACLSTTAPLEDEPVTAVGAELSGSFDTYVILNDENTTINGSGAAFEDGVLTVHSPGTYYLRGTLSDGAVVIRTDARDEVSLILSGVALHCDDAVPLKIESAPGGTRLVLEEDTVNKISDGITYDRSDDSGAAVIFSADDLTIDGEGLLSVTGENDGIAADCVTLLGGTLLVDAGDDSVLTTDTFAVTGGSLLASAGCAGACTPDGTHLNVCGSYPAGTVLRVLSDDGNALLQTTLTHDCAHLLIADSRLVRGESYGIAADGTVTETVIAK